MDNLTPGTSQSGPNSLGQQKVTERGRTDVQHFCQNGRAVGQIHARQRPMRVLGRRFGSEFAWLHSFSDSFVRQSRGDTTQSFGISKTPAVSGRLLAKNLAVEDWLLMVEKTGRVPKLDGRKLGGGETGHWTDRVVFRHGIQVLRLAAVVAGASCGWK